MQLLSAGNSPSLIIKLINTPQQFTFCQAVRLLKCYSQSQPGELRFCGRASLQFPVSAISAIKLCTTDNKIVYELETDIISLYGATGILPNHYTELIIQRLQAKDITLRNFLDIFNHRIISLFYQAWQKYHFYVGYEQAKQSSTTDKFSQAIFSLTGNGIASLQNRSLIPDENFLYYAGLFVQFSRSANGLQALLADYFSIDVTIEQFRSRSILLTKNICTTLNSKSEATLNYNQLGYTTLLGRHGLDRQRNFRIRINNLSYIKFQQFLPNNPTFSAVVAMATRYVNAAFDFDIQLNLLAAEVPGCRLLSENALGWNCWLKTKSPLHNAQDTILKVKKLH